MSQPPLIDPLGRTVRYLRLSVTDRCDLRCVYCMGEEMRFLPKPQTLSLEELERLAGLYIQLGVDKIRITGGEPLVRKGIMSLIQGLALRRQDGLKDLVLTTNATRLAEHAAELAHLGVSRINVSVDSLKPEVFRRITRGGDLAKVMAGIDAGQAAGLKLKINIVALADQNADEIPGIIAFAHGRGMDATVIEAMPMGEIGEQRVGQYLSLAKLRETLSSFWRLTDLDHSTGGPARYVRVEETGGLLGFITPLSHNFCSGCNRVRLTVAGTMHTCLGQDDATDLRAPMRAGASDEELIALIREGVGAKPHGHDFAVGQRMSVNRHMSVTGG
ncbi:MAG: 3,8-cyclase MoaA [Caulobacteraceae bacterium]|nr:3,8-cyclase MoaA [Caulobacteraceae bacterium]